MREIKFRAWDKARKELFPISMNVSYGGFSDWGLMQCIGLKDKTGKDIYEGDIVKWSEDHLTDGGESIKTLRDVGEVFWSPEFAMFGLKGSDMGHWQFYENQEYEVLGNIYENPELLT